MATQVKQHEFYRVKDVMTMLEISQTKAYQIIKGLNDELKEQGKIVIAGRVSKKYFDERLI
uniref:transcriptional regulator n=1 Tax=Jeotgalibaca porci TaxID=1868793 RepID=UPI0035A0B4FF